jgi:hypothetical protein
VKRFEIWDEAIGATSCKGWSVGGIQKSAIALQYRPRCIPVVAPERIETRSFMIQKESPSGELQAVRLRQKFLVFYSSG